MKSSVRRRTWGSIIPLLTLVTGTLFAASASTARGTDLRAGGGTGGSGRAELTRLIAAEQRRSARERSDYRRLLRDVDAVSRRVGQSDARVRQARQEADALAAAAGFAPVKGPGLRVVLDDAPQRPRNVYERPDIRTPTADDLVVHQSDVQAVVNALWAGGASGVQIMDQRLIATSAVRCVGNTLILQGVVYSPPFRITAVGDPVRLRRALGVSPEIATYREYVRAYGLGYTVRTLDRVTLAGYAGNVTMNHAQPRGWNTADADPRPR